MPGILSAFLGKITRNIAIDRWRREKTAKRGEGSLELTLVLGRREEKIISQEIWGGGMQFLQRDDSYLSFNTFTWHRLEWAADGWTVRDLPDHPSVWDMEQDTSEWYDVEDYLTSQDNQS